MSESQTPATRPTDGRKRRRVGDAEPVVIEGVRMLDINEHTELSKQLYSSIVKDIMYSPEKFKPEKVKIQKRIRQAKEQGGAPIVRASFRDNWTSEWDEQAKQKFEATRTKWQLPIAQQTHYLGLAKTTMLHAGCSPRDIVGVQTKLVFDRNYKTSSIASRCPPCPFKAWPSMFCEKLNKLVTHPAWFNGQPGGRASTLASALQYTVILRTGDRRPWTVGVLDPFVESIQYNILRGMPARNAHARARNALLSSGTFLHVYHLSNVFLALEDALPGVVHVADSVDADSLFYYVTYDDLDVLVGALDSMTDPDTGSCFLSTEVYFKMALAIRPANELIPANSELADFHEQVMLEECRRLVYLEQFQTSGQASYPVQDDYIADGMDLDSLSNLGDGGRSSSPDIGSGRQRVEKSAPPEDQYEDLYEDSLASLEADTHEPSSHQADERRAEQEAADKEAAEREAAEKAAREAAEQAAEMAEQAAEMAREATERAAEKAREATGRAADMAERMAEIARETAAEMAREASEQAAMAREAAEQAAMAPEAATKLEAAEAAKREAAEAAKKEVANREAARKVADAAEH